MLSSQNYNNWLIRFLFVLIRNFQKWHVYSAVRLSNRRKFYELKRTCFSDFTYLPEMRLHLSISVWNCVGNKNFIAAIFEFIVKTHNIVWFWFVRIHFVNFYMIRWDVIIDIKSTLKPARAIGLITFETPETGFHSVIEKRVTFGKIDYVDSYHIGEILRILHPKIKPLQITTSVGVISNPNVVLNYWPLSNLINVSAFKLGIEHNMVGLNLFALMKPTTHFEWSSKTKHFLYFVCFWRQMILIFLSINKLLISRIPNFVKLDWLVRTITLNSFGLYFLILVSCFGSIFVVTLFVVPTLMMSTIFSTLSPICYQYSWILTISQSSTWTS